MSPGEQRRSIRGEAFRIRVCQARTQQSRSRAARPAGTQADWVPLMAKTAPCHADSTEESGATGEEADLAESLPSSRRRRQRSRSKAASEGELRERWSWLSEIKPEDKPWIYFALHRAHNAKVISSSQQLVPVHEEHPLPSECQVWPSPDRSLI